MQPPDEAPSWTSLCSDFLTHLRVDCGCSTHTIAAYKNDLSDWHACLSQGLDWTDTTVFDLGPAQLEAAYDRLSERGLDPRSLARKISAIHRYFTFISREYGRSQIPTETLVRPKLGTPLPRSRSLEDVQALFLAAQAGLPYTHHAEILHARDRALLAVLYATGIRVSECAGILLEDIRNDDRTVLIRGKGSKQRLVPLGDVAWKELERYLACRAHEAHLWLNARGTPLSRQTIWKVIGNLAGQAGIPKLSPHVLRHSFATHLLAEGMGLRSLQKLLGHSDLGTTEKYTDVTPQHLAELIRNYHPRG